MSYRDDFDDPERENALAALAGALDIPGRLRAGGPLLTVVPLVVLAAALAGVLVWSYPRAKGGADAPVPTVHADAGPYKVAPDDPGGMDIPWRESTVFDRMRAGDADAGAVENLLSPPEQPLPRADLIAAAGPVPDQVTAVTEEKAAAPAVNDDVVTADVTETVTNDKALDKAVPAVPVPAAKPSATSVAAAATEEKVVAKTVAKAVAKTEPAAGASAGAGAYVQLGSLKSRADAQAAWKKFQSDFSQLGALTLRIEEADLGAKGTYYRVQGGPVSADKAQSICAAVVAKRPGGCLVVHH